MNAREIAEFKDLLGDIGSGKRDGFIFMATTDGEKAPEEGEGISKTDGVVFAHNADPETMVVNLIMNLGVDPMKVAVLTLGRSMRISQKEVARMNPRIKRAEKK